MANRQTKYKVQARFRSTHNKLLIKWPRRLINPCLLERFLTFSFDETRITSQRKLKNCAHPVEEMIFCCLKLQEKLDR